MPVQVAEYLVKEGGRLVPPARGETRAEGKTLSVTLMDEAIRSRAVTELADDGAAGDDLPFGVRGKRLASRKEREAAKAAGLPVPD
jgi:hypothetical protein